MLARRYNDFRRICNNILYIILHVDGGFMFLNCLYISVEKLNFFILVLFFQIAPKHDFVGGSVHTWL